MSIIIENLSYVYSPKSPYEKQALKNINLTIEDGDYFGIIGHTGSGKSTLISHPHSERLDTRRRHRLETEKTRL